MIWKAIWGFISGTVGRYVVAGIVALVAAYAAQIYFLHAEIDRKDGTIESLESAAVLTAAEIESRDKTIKKQSEGIAVIIKNSRIAQEHNDQVLADFKQQQPQTAIEIVREKTDLATPIDECAAVELSQEVRDAF